MANLQKKGQKNFLAGMNPDTADLQLNENIGEVILLQNMSTTSRPGALEALKGTQFYNSVQGAADSTATIGKTIARFYKSTGGAFTVVSWKTGAVYGLSVVTATAETLLDNALTAAITDYAVFNDTLYMANGTNNLYSWDGVAAGLTTVTFPLSFTPTILEMYKRRMHYAGDAAFPSRVIFSQPSQPDIFDVPFLNFQDVFDDDGDEIRALVVFGDELLVFKERIYYRWQGVPVQSIVKSQLDGIGCINPDTMSRSKFGIVFLSKLGIYRLSSQGAQNVSLILSPVQMSNILNRNENDFSAVMFKGVYYLFFRSATSTAIEEGLTFDFNALEYGATFPAANTVKNFNIQNSVVLLGSADADEWYGVMSGTNNVLRVDGPNSTYYQNNANPAVPLEQIIFTKWEDNEAAWRKDELRILYLYFHKPMENVRIKLIVEVDGKSRTAMDTTIAIGEVTLWDAPTSLWDSSVWDGAATLMTYIKLDSGIYAERYRLELSANDINSPLNFDGFDMSFIVGTEL